VDKKLQKIKKQIHTLMDGSFKLDIKNELPELIAKNITLQNIINSFHLSDKEIFQYLSDKEVKCYIKKYQSHCLDFECYIEQLLSEALTNPQNHSDIIRFLRNYYSNIYEVMVKNEIVLAKVNKHSTVCMVGVGSMPLSMLFMHRFAGSKVVGIDKSKETIQSTKRCIECVSQYAPQRYPFDAFTLWAVDGEGFDYASFDVIVLSIHIENKEAVIKQVLDTVLDKHHLVLLERKVVGLCEYFYKNNSINPGENHLVLGDSTKSGVITTQALMCNL
jgi:hypothetical protein